MEEGNGFYRLNPDWEPIANEKNVFGMANAMYADLKQHMFGGVMIPQESINELMFITQKVLHADFGWSEEELRALGDKFTELNQYYLDETEESHIFPPSALMVIPHLGQNGLIPGTTHIHMEIVRKKKDRSGSLHVKEIIMGIVEIAVCCLAIIGLMFLIGLL